MRTVRAWAFFMDGRTPLNVEELVAELHQRGRVYFILPGLEGPPGVRFIRSDEVPSNLKLKVVSRPEVRQWSVTLYGPSLDMMPDHPPMDYDTLIDTLSNTVTEIKEAADRGQRELLRSLFMQIALLGEDLLQQLEAGNGS